jgi:hypothetical protein
MRRSLLLGLLAIAGLAAGHAQAPHSQAVFHFAVIDEVMTSYGGDANVQFVEIRMLSSGQNLVMNSVLGAFDASGSYLGDVLIVPGNVASSGVGVRWIMGTSAFATASGLTPDFTMPGMGGVSLPTSGGMVCWGAPGVSPPAPGSWDHTNPSNYVDCLAYGTYSGPTNVHIGTPTSLDGIGHSLQRVTETNNNANDFVCADPATPKKNNGTAVTMAATTSCVIDSDGDGLSDADETGVYGTNPADPDSDDDGLNDGDEVNVHGSDPLKADSDDDGSNDFREFNMGTILMDSCPNTAIDDAWPYDTTKSKKIDVNDLLGSPASFKNSFGSSQGDPEYSARYDFNASLAVDVNDLLGAGKSFKNSFGTACANGSVRIDQTGDGPFELTSPENFHYTFDKSYTINPTWGLKVLAANPTSISFRLTCPGADQQDFSIAFSGGTQTRTCADSSKVEVAIP